MTCGVYGLFDAETDECLYVGLSKDIEERWKGHLKNLKNGKHIRTEFVDWFRAHDNDPLSIKWIVLEECSKEGLNRNEIKWFNRLRPKFYGAKPGLTNHTDLSEITKQKISKSIQKYLIKSGKVAKIYKFTCEQCHKEFESKVKKRIYCSSKCSNMNGGSKRKILATPEIEAHIKQLYNVEFKTMLEISKILGISDASVQHLMVEFGIERRKAGVTTKKRPPVSDEKRKKLSEAHSNKEKIECEYCGDMFTEGLALNTHKAACSVTPFDPWPHCLHCNKRLSKRTAKYCFDHRFPSMR